MNYNIVDFDYKTQYITVDFLDYVINGQETKNEKYVVIEGKIYDIDGFDLSDILNYMYSKGYVYISSHKSGLEGKLNVLVFSKKDL